MASESRTVFRPCIDLHEGKVKQIVGGSLTEKGENLQTNFVARKGAAYYAELYCRDGLTGGHVIMLGPGNEEAAISALQAWPQGLQVGGGITLHNASKWLQRGASKVIVTSWLFPGGEFSRQRLAELSASISPARLVIDLSCRRKGDSWYVTTNKWQTLTDMEITAATLGELSQYCSEFLVHAADHEGLSQGIDEALVKALGCWSSVPCVYAGGAKALDDLARVEELSGGKVDLTIGSALDLFGGSVRYVDCVVWNKGCGR